GVAYMRIRGDLVSDASGNVEVDGADPGDGPQRGWRGGEGRDDPAAVPGQAGQRHRPGAGLRLYGHAARDLDGVRDRAHQLRRTVIGDGERLAADGAGGARWRLGVGGLLLTEVEDPLPPVMVMLPT